MDLAENGLTVDCAKYTNIYITNIAVTEWLDPTHSYSEVASLIPTLYILMAWANLTNKLLKITRRRFQKTYEKQ